MGDFLLPGNGTAGSSIEYERERLRRRFERYRQVHANHQQQHENYTAGIYPQQAQETQLLHKRWQETVSSKKPIAKASNVKMQQRAADAAGGLPGSQPAGASAAAKKFKRTANGQFKSASAESPPTSGGTIDATYSSFDERLSPAVAPSCGGATMHNSVSVNINVDANLHRSQSAIKLTFSSTINGHAAQPVPGPTVPPQQPGAGHPMSGTTATGENAASRQSPQSFLPDSIGNLEDFDDLSDLLDKFAQEDGGDGLPPPDILKMLDGADFVDSHQLSQLPPPCSREPPTAIPVSRYVTSVSSFPSGFGATPAGIMAPFGGPTSTLPTKVLGDPCVGVLPPGNAPTLLGDTGPAAETLKQMAAQHQNQENAIGRHYAAAGYVDGFHPGSYQTAPRLPRYPGQQYSTGYLMSPAMYAYDGSGRTGYMTADPVVGCTPGMEQCYRPSRFPMASGGSGVQTSLQRLESQVHSHFAPTAGIGPSPVDIQHFRMEQSQRIDMRGQHLAAMAQQQQQSFSMSMDASAAGMAPSHMYATSERCGQPVYGQYHPGAIPYRMMPAGYQCMPQGAGGGVGIPAGVASSMQQQCTAMTGVPGRVQPTSAPMVTTPFSNAPARSVESDPPTSGRTSAPAKGTGRSAPAGQGTPVMAPTHQAKMESVGTYSTNDNSADNSRMLKTTDPTPTGYSNVLIKGGGQRPPNVTVGPCGSMNFQPMGKWVPRVGGPGVMPTGQLPSGMHNPYMSGYITDDPSSGVRMESPGGGAPGGWSLSMSQTQSVYVAGPMPGGMQFRPGCPDPAAFSRSQPRPAGYPTNAGFQAAPIVAAAMPGDGMTMMHPSDYAAMQRNRQCIGGSNYNMEGFPAVNCAGVAPPEYGYVDDVFTGK